MNLKPRDSGLLYHSPYAVLILEAVELRYIDTLENLGVEHKQVSANIQFSQKPEIKFILHKDTLYITVRVTAIQKKDAIVYNKKENKYETMHVFEMKGNVHIDVLAPKRKIETFVFKGFKKCPTTIYRNGIHYKKVTIQ